MEEIVEPTSPAQTRANTRIHSRAHSRAHSRTNTGSGSFANFAIPTERQPLLARATAIVENSYEENLLGPVDRDRPVAGGTVLGIHNLAIVFPQFIVCRFSLFDRFLWNGSRSTRVW
jgi:solute carrier family 45 protein 1/2/4